MRSHSGCNILQARRRGDVASPGILALSERGAKAMPHIRQADVLSEPPSIRDSCSIYLRQQPSIHDQIGSRHVCTFVRGKENRCAGDVFG